VAASSSDGWISIRDFAGAMEVLAADPTVVVAYSPHRNRQDSNTLHIDRMSYLLDCFL
jgi:hypothetical protein